MKHQDEIYRRSTGGAHRKYSCNDDFFEVIDSEKKAYWLGFLAADGNISSSQSHMTFALAIKDIDVVERFKGALEATYPIHHRFRELNGKTFERATLSIRSKKLCMDLVDKGVVPRKSLILKPPQNIPKNLVHHWIRGYFDGDGSVYLMKVKKSGNKYKKVSITGTLEVLNFIQKRLESGHVSDRRPRSRVHRFIIGRQEDVEKFGDYIYRDATVYLERKKRIFGLGLK